MLEGRGKKLLLFDTFSGMPPTHPEHDFHQEGDFPSEGVEKVREFVGHEDSVEFHPGVIPDSFSGLDDTKIAFAHVDCDIYSATKACCEFIYPRLDRGGMIVFDDYGRPTCQGVRIAVDAYCAENEIYPFTIPATGQAVMFKP